MTVVNPRYAVFWMAAGPEAPTAAEAESLTGAVQAIVTMANEGAPGWFIVVDREARYGQTAAVAYYAPEGITVADLWGRPPRAPWIEAARV